MPPDEMRKLLAHALPPSMSDAQLAAVFPPDAPMAVAVERNSKEPRKALLVFSSAKDAAAAFRALSGQETVDSTGRYQVLRN